MTKYLVQCNNPDCKHQFPVDEPPPENAKPRINDEDLEPAGILKQLLGKMQNVQNVGKGGQHHFNHKSMSRPKTGTRMSHTGARTPPISTNYIHNY